MIERIDTVCLRVTDLEKSSNWYQEKLGFNLSFQGEGYRVLTVGKNGVSLTIEQSKGSQSSGRNHCYPIFYSNNIKEMHKQLKMKNEKVGALSKDGVNTFFDFYDLDNNKLQVCFFE